MYLGKESVLQTLPCLVEVSLNRSQNSWPVLTVYAGWSHSFPISTSFESHTHVTSLYLQMICYCWLQIHSGRPLCTCSHVLLPQVHIALDQVFPRVQDTGLPFITNRIVYGGGHSHPQGSCELAAMSLTMPFPRTSCFSHTGLYPVVSPRLNFKLCSSISDGFWISTRRNSIFKLLRELFIGVLLKSNFRKVLSRFFFQGQCQWVLDGHWEN